MAVPTRDPEGGTAALPSRKVWRPNPRSCSPDAAAESNGEASDVDPTSGDGADFAAESNASPLMPPRQSRGCQRWIRGFLWISEEGTRKGTVLGSYFVAVMMFLVASRVLHRC